MSPMTSLQRVLTTLGHQEPDRVPFLLLATMHGARELGLSIEEYFGRAENLVEGQRRMRLKYQHDCLSNFFYASLEMEAWGGETVFREDGPPNSGRPIISRFADILELAPPRIQDSPGLLKVLEATRQLKSLAGDEVPVIGVAISPLSLPMMQMGFEKYLDLMHDRFDLFERLMQINQAFCVEWANAQLAAGATAICYFDPVSSPTIIPKELYLKTGFPIARQTLAQIHGPAIIHLASGRAMPILDELAQTGTVAVGVSALEDLAELKEVCRGKVSLLGNLNGVEMRRWTTEQTERVVKEAIAKAGPGGGYILSDNHGEIPWQVPDEVLTTISESVRRWGVYPLRWVTEDGG
ncbi:MAG: uroporphyrinogen decarboxylase family protein [Dehalococcoidia bacterium]|nr:uroporphyrinogen decarboxylase family protein [Dehalococcoidia bacterium]